ncbi:MAG: hypothetical protein M3137_07330, partial [Actinomycetota bacterium]|nr:hypothetical protein [Actinomycetota bacterium]
MRRAAGGSASIPEGATSGMSRQNPAAATRRSGRPTDAEILAAKRIVSRTERREVEEAERLCQDARRVLEAASAEAEKSRSEAERVLAESRRKAGRILADAEAVLAESRAEAERIRADTTVATKAAGESEAPREDIEGRIREDIEGRIREALSAVDPSTGEIALLSRLLSDDLSSDVRLAALRA